MMKSLAAIISICFFSAITLHGQNYRFDEGGVTMDVINMTSYGPDTTAGAVVISESYTVDYDRGSQRRDYFSKVKILDASELYRGIVTIPYYSPEEGVGETVTRIRATCYNGSGGKIKKSRLNPREVLTEDMGNGYKVIYFAIPDVEVGSVVEYGYRIIRRGPAPIPPVEIQKDIPVIRSKVRVRIPDAFCFAAVIRGAIQPLDGISKTGNGYSERFVTFKEFFESEWRDVPAFREEPYVWSRYDMIASCDFIPVSNDDGTWIYDLTPSWRDITAELKPILSPDTVYVPSILSEEIDALPAGIADSIGALGQIHRMVTGKVKWNNVYNLYPESPDSVLIAGTGGSGDMNYILLSALRYAGFRAEPVFLRPRSMGRLPQYTYTEDIVTFIVRITMDDGTLLYMDGTDPHSWINTFRDELMTDRARVFYSDSLTQTWTNLSSVGRNMVLTTVDGHVADSGILECEVTEAFKGVPALKETAKYRGQLFEGDYWQSLEKNINIPVNSFSFERDTSAVVRSYAFSRRLAGKDGEYALPVNPVAGKQGNPIAEGGRILPFEFQWPREYVINIAVKLPKGFVIREIPANMVLTTTQGGIKYMALYAYENDVFRASFSFQMDRIFYKAEEKDELYAFFRTMIASNMETVILSAAR